ncbi:toxin biosynthesis protein-like protein [Penicillium herquei]|nr:toxin biosynthesis protein-like protein [Penicillium herquei]
MSSDRFTVTEHEISGSHIREYPGSTIDQEAVLKLHIKQYTPKNQPYPVPKDAITFIVAHGSALPKELYEPLWDELLEQHGFHIRGIWVADCANMNASGILNEEKLSMDASWMDHSRDLFLMINQFRDQMPRPLVGIGHSFGGNVITNLAYMHPRLFTTLLLIEPVIQLTPPAMGFGTDAPGLINATLYRDDVWPSREAAVRANRALFAGWDPRCIERMIKYGFRDLPTALYPDVDAVKARFNTDASESSTSTPVTLTTSKYQDLITQMRENFSARDPTTGRVSIPRSTHADLNPLAAFIPMYRPEPTMTFLRLPSLRPSCLWVIGGSTYLKIDEMMEGIKVCGTGIGGSGGIPENKVKEIIIPGMGHLLPFQDVKKTVDPCSIWLREEMKRYRKVEKDWEELRAERNHLMVEDAWYKTLKPIPSRWSKI